MVHFCVEPAGGQNPIAAKPYQTWDNPGGAPWATFYRTPSGFLLRFFELADFAMSADGQQITCFPAPGISAATVDHLFHNQVQPLALGKRGKLVFHGSAVEIGDEAIAFLAESGRGKSTLAAAFAAGRRRFLTDDGLVLEPVDGGYRALPSHPSLRLWQDSHEQLLGSDAETAPPLDFTSKSRFLAGDRLTHCDEPRPLRTAYFLGDGSAEEIAFSRLTPAEALIAWAKHSFILDVEDRAQLGGHFRRTAALANTVVCYELDFPRRFADIGRVLESIETHATNLGKATQIAP